MTKTKLFGNRGWRLRLATAGTAAALLSTALITGATGAGTVAASAATKYNIVLIPGLTTDPFYITMGVGAQAEAKKLGVNLTWKGATTWSTTLQVPIVNSTLATHPSALLIAPTDDVALFKPMDAYVKAGIPVISVDTTLKDQAILAAAISSDNYQGGEAAADAIAKAAHDKGQVAVINVEKGVSTTDLRQAGFLAEMKKYPNMQVVATEYDNDSPTMAESQARAIILGHKSLVGIFGTNLYSAEGTAKGVDAAGMKGKIFVAGYDAEPAEVSLLKKGVINILVIQNPAEEGSLAVQYAYDYLTGDKSMIKKNVLLPNVIATTANAGNPAVAKYFYKTSL
ncbi:MAG TPA: ABC transporter substrate-binding protein [Acidimicrobiales bacterium]|nr:ABC transporter substrate-binding protein [Acidimicrobiales bacterium]